MTDAPERIWAVVGYAGTDAIASTDVVCGEFHNIKGVLYGDETEYVRADLTAWQPIETAPKTLDEYGMGEMVRLFFPDYYGSDMQWKRYAPGQREGYWVGSKSKGKWVTPGTVSSNSPNPTHWMPLPDPPK